MKFIILLLIKNLVSFFLDKISHQTLQFVSYSEILVHEYVMANEPGESILINGFIFYDQWSVLKIYMKIVDVFNIVQHFCLKIYSRRYAAVPLQQ